MDISAPFYFNNLNNEVKNIIINFGCSVFEYLRLNELNEEEIIMKYSSSFEKNKLEEHFKKKEELLNNIQHDRDKQTEERINSMRDKYENRIEELYSKNDSLQNDINNKVDEIVNAHITNNDKYHKLERDKLLLEVNHTKEYNDIYKLIEDKLCDNTNFSNTNEQGDYTEKIFDDIVKVDGLKYDEDAKIIDTSDIPGSGDRIIQFSNGFRLMIEIKNKNTIEKSDIEEFEKHYKKDFDEKKIDGALFFSYRTPQIPNICTAIIPKYFNNGEVIYYGLKKELPYLEKKEKIYDSINEIYIRSLNKNKNADNNIENVHIYNDRLQDLNEMKLHYTDILKVNKKDIITITGKLKSIDTKLNQTYRDIQNNNIPVDKNLLDERIYKKNMIEKIKEWKKKSDNGDKKNWKSFYKEENLMSEYDIIKLKSITLANLLGS